MNTFEYLTTVAEQHHDELLKQSAQSRMLKEAFLNDKPKLSSRSRFWVKAREEIYYLVYTIQGRFRDMGETRMTARKPGNSEGCV